jgi:uncharacterized protein
MIYKQYGNTDKQLSAIGFGGMRFSDPHNIDECAEIVLYAYKRGINYFDTAPNYCQDKSEDIMGAAFRQMEKGTFFTSSKSSKANGRKLRGDLERSLKRLGVDSIDFYHSWCLLSLESWEERKERGAVKELQKAKEEGLIKHIVFSSHLPGNKISAVLDEGVFEGVTLGYCAINFPYRETAVERAGDLGLGVVTMNPLGGGIIPMNPDRLSFLKTENDRSVVEAALRFNISNPNVTCALVGFSSKNHVDQAIDAVDGFKPYPIEKTDSIRKKILASFDKICTGCGYCLPCPEGVNIPQMMDVYNQKILKGGDTEHMRERLQWHWSKPASHALLCSECGICEERCTQQLPIRERLKEIGNLA